MKKSLVLFAAALAFLIAGTTVRADSIPWGYSATSTSITNNNNASATSTINFTAASGVASGNSGIIIYNLTTSSTAMSTSPQLHQRPVQSRRHADGHRLHRQHFPHAGHQRHTELRRHVQRHQRDLEELAPRRDQLDHADHGEHRPGSARHRLEQLQRADRQLHAPRPARRAPGSIEAVVSITPATGPGGSGSPPPNSTPEPASLVLAGLGLPFIFFARRRMKQS